MALSREILSSWRKTGVESNGYNLADFSGVDLAWLFLRRSYGFVDACVVAEQKLAKHGKPDASLFQPFEEFGLHIEYVHLQYEQVDINNPEETLFKFVPDPRLPTPKNLSFKTSILPYRSYNPLIKESVLAENITISENVLHDESTKFAIEIDISRNEKLEQKRVDVLIRSLKEQYEKLPNTKKISASRVRKQIINQLRVLDGLHHDTPIDKLVEAMWPNQVGRKERYRKLLARAKYMVGGGYLKHVDQVLPKK